MGKPFLLVLEGLDGSGKSTQCDLLTQRLRQEDIFFQRISFPDYQDPSSSLVRMYLSGEFGGSPQEVNPYAAASFYAVDRYASYQRFWRRPYHDGAVIIADRYTTSNLIYQMPKLPKDQWDAFSAWVEDYEYGKLGLPRPDGVLYLDVSPEVSQELLTQRYEGDEGKKDLHERSRTYLLDCRHAALFCVQKQGWKAIPCAKEGAIREKEAIHQEIWEYLRQFLPTLRRGKERTQKGEATK